MFEVKDVKKTYKTDFWSSPVEVLSNVSFSVSKGQVVGFLGANGAGKTTLIKMMMGFTRSDSGVIHFFDNQSFDCVASRIGYLPERPYFYPHLTGREMIEFMGALCDLSGDEIKNAIQKYADRLKINFALDRKIKGYSKGMLQRLGMLCTLIHDPDLIILDEPLSGLDPQGRKDIKDLLLELSKEDKTIFFSSHIVSDVEEVCEKVIVLDKGTIMYEGSIVELIQENSNQEFLITVDGEDEELKKMAKSSYMVNHSTTYLVDEDRKKEFIHIIMHKKIEIIKLIKNSPSLEEVVYKTDKIV